MDDGFLILRQDRVDDVLGTFNDGSEDLKFTCDNECGRNQCFLDTEVSVENDSEESYSLQLS